MDSDINTKLKKFFSKYAQLEYKKDEVIIHSAKEEIDYIFFITSGMIKQSFTSIDGEDITINIFRNNTYFPMMIALSKHPNKYNFTAISDVVLNKAPTDEVITFIKSDSDILFDLTTRLSDGLCGILLKLENLYFKSAFYKVGSLLLYLSDKFGTIKDDAVEIQLMLTQSEIASWIGISRETVSRQLTKMVNLELIEYVDKYFIIKDRQKLKSELNNKN